MLEIIAIKTLRGYYITDNTEGKERFISKLSRLLFDGREPERTFMPDWFYIDSPPKEVGAWTKQSGINHRYELIDTDFVTKMVSMELDPDIVTARTDSYGERVWRSEYAHLKSMYRLVSDEQPDKFKPVEFSFKIVLELDKVREFRGFSYPIFKSSHMHEETRQLNQASAKNQLLDRILFPSIVLANHPCQLTSRQSFDIVRAHVTHSIDLAVAKITSNYDFCFAVVKRIALARPFTHRAEIRTAKGKSYKKRRWQETYMKTRDAKAFEMTWAPKCYGDYTPMQEFRGENWDNLEQNINKFLEELMTIINTPLQECPNCNGMGVIESLKDTSNGAE